VGRKCHDAVWTRHIEWLQNQRLQHAKDDDVGGYPQRQNEHSSDGKTGRAAYLGKGKSQVLQKRVQMGLQSLMESRNPAASTGPNGLTLLSGCERYKWVRRTGILRNEGVRVHQRVSNSEQSGQAVVVLAVGRQQKKENHAVYQK